MHICTTITPFFRFPRIHPPLALGYLATIAKDRGHTCDILDLRLRFERDIDEHTRNKLCNFGMIYFEPTLPKEVLDILEPHINTWAVEIAATQPRVFGISCFRPTRVVSLTLAVVVKTMSPETFIVVGGPESTLCYEEILKCQAIDGVVIGDGEEAFIGLLDAIEFGHGFSDVPNLIYRSGTTVKQSTVTRHSTAKSFVIPDFSGLPISEYYTSHPDDPPIMPILWQRGCTGNCTFCNARKFFPNVNARSPESVVDEMRHHYQKYGVKLFEFYDLSLNNYPSELYKLCKLLIALPERFEWFGMMRFSHALNNDLIKTMAQSGCIRISFGLESGSPNVLKHMRKNYDMELISNTLRALYQNGIDTHCTIIVGYPTETEEDFQKTIQFLEHNQQFISEINSGSTCSISRHRPIWELMDKMGIKFDENGDWYLNGNTLQVRIDRLRRLNSAVRTMAFQRSQRFDAFTDNLAKSKNVLSPNQITNANSLPIIQEWPVRKVSKFRKS